VATFLLTWNPDKWAEPDKDKMIEATRMTRAVLTEHIVKLAYPDTSVHLP